MTGRDLLVVGSGLGGLTAALRADALGHAVTLVTKGALDDSNSRWAQGGIAAAVFPDDSPALHAADTVAAGAGLSLDAAVDALCSDGPDRIRDLVRWGVVFDETEPSAANPEGWARGLEAAHGRARVLHAGGDATGRAIVVALVERLRASRVRVVEHAVLTDLVLTVTGERRVAGAEILRDGHRETLLADAVILATGGAGQLYEFTTNPEGATGDGLAAAWRAGAEVADLEFYQFHPTALAVPGSFLVSEAVRGEGAVLLDAGGRRFLAGVDRRAELAPRDIVARAIAEQMKRQAGLPVLLDATHLGRATLEARFPTITAATRAAGLDWASEPVPVTPAAHYFMGGVRTDLWGRTSLPGLSAVGEVAVTGVHGANRLASNSLLEAAVFGWRAVAALDADETAERGVLAGAAVETPPASGGGGSVILRGDLQRLMWDAAGVERNGRDLLAAAQTLAEASAPDDGSAEGREAANLLDVARLVVTAALAREESRGAHFRSDFPDTRDETAHALTWAREVPEHAHR
ncbi:L-aspartate oxidase [Frondihabitans peucedani]|uniref:L-aspartate oxidase n=1 Tax=Frondihabitans peucedani TaxID=598626 RepID=A0ABP8E0L7_9MICO